MNSLSSTQSFTKDIYSRMKQISVDLLQLKKENNELHNKNLSSLEERLTRLEILVETKLNNILEKIDNQSLQVNNSEEPDESLLNKLDDLNNFNTSPIISTINSPNINSPNNEINDANIESINLTDTDENKVENINFDKFFMNIENNNANNNIQNNLNNNQNKKENIELSINNIDDIMIL